MLFLMDIIKAKRCYVSVLLALFVCPLFGLIDRWSPYVITVPVHPILAPVSNTGSQHLCYSHYLFTLSHHHITSPYHITISHHHITSPYHITFEFNPQTTSRSENNKQLTATNVCLNYFTNLLIDRFGELSDIVFDYLFCQT